MTTAVPLMTEMDKSSENVAASAPQVSQFSYGTVGGNAGPVAGAPTNPYSGSGASLYVGDLHPDTNEAALFEHFSQIGPVASIRVCRDAVTRRSLGYAYVNYHNGMDADRALDVLNYSPIRGRPCRLMKSQRDPSLRKSGSGNVFIKNLDKSVDNKALHDTFSAFGNVLSCKVVLDPHGQSKGFAFVHFETQEAADKAIARINGKLLNGKVVFAGRYQSRKERQSKSDEIKTIYTNVFVKNLDPSMNNDEFAQLVSAFGKVTSAVIQTDENGASKGFGFVNYESHSDADAAVQGLNGKTVNGREIFAARAQLKAERVEELKKTFEKLREERLSRFTNLYVKNLADEIDEEKLKAEFAPYGEISSCVIMRDEKGDSRGFGFVSFENLTDASKAINEMNGKLLLTKPLYVAVAQRKEERRAQLEAQHAQRMMRHYAAPMFYPGAMSRPGFAYPPVQGMVPRQPRVIPQQQNGINAPGYPPQVMAPGATNVPTGIRQYRSIRNQQSSDSQSSGGYTRNVPRSSVQQPSGGPRYGGQKNHPGKPAHDQGPGINAAALAAASPEEQKQMLGERLYVLIKGRQPELAGKITGMLLEMDNGEILHLLESPETLNAKIDEALEVINFHAQQQQQQSQ